MANQATAQTQTARQAGASVDVRKKGIAEQLATQAIRGGSRSGDSALVGELTFTNTKLLPAFMSIARPQVQRLIQGIATLMADGDSLTVTADLLEDVDTTYIKPYYKSQSNDVVGYYASALLGSTGWGGENGDDFINAGNWANFRATHNVDDTFAVFEVKRPKRS